jgi:hypothetical protein
MEKVSLICRFNKPFLIQNFCLFHFITLLIFMMNVSDVCSGLLIIFFLTFWWQHLGGYYDWYHKPSVYFHLVADVCEQVYTSLGICLAFVSGYMHTIIENLGNLWQLVESLSITMNELLTPVMRICMAPCRIITGYVNKARSFATPGYILLGTLGLLWLPAIVWCFCQPEGTFLIRRFDGTGETTLPAIMMITYFIGSFWLMLWFGETYLSIMVAVNQFLNRLGRNGEPVRPAPRRGRQPRVAGRPGGPEFH